MVRVGGRPAQITVEDIVHAGRQIGLVGLSLKEVATRLGVSSTALYRHVDGRWGLENLVGESILADLELVDDPEDDTAAHLLSLGMQLRSFILKHPGLAVYVQTLFPRGHGGRRLLATAVDTLGVRGYTADAAIVLASAVASVAIGYAAAEDAQRQRSAEREQQEQHAVAEMLHDPVLGKALRTLPQVNADEYVRMWLGAAVRAFVAAAPPGRSPDQILVALQATEREH